MNLRVNTRNRAKYPNEHTFYVSSHHHWKNGFTHTKEDDRSHGARNMNVCEVDSESMVYQHFCSSKSSFSCLLQCLTDLLTWCLYISSKKLSNPISRERGWTIFANFLFLSIWRLTWVTQYTVKRHEVQDYLWYNVYPFSRMSWLNSPQKKQKTGRPCVPSSELLWK